MRSDLGAGVNILLLGSGKGAWVIRGEQLGAAIGARATSAPTQADYKWADLIVLIKRGILHFGREAVRSGKRIVWDALDFWAQPDQNTIDEASAIRLVHEWAEKVNPALIICMTESMAAAVGGVYVPHHARPGLCVTPMRDRVHVVGYEGSIRYLGNWLPTIEAACKARGWRFVTNPDDLSAVDLVLALRSGVWDGWICREWKSGVKLVNAMAAGRPVITQPSAAFREVCPVGATVESPGDLSVALDRCAAADVRTLALEQPGLAALTLEQVAAQYQRILHEGSVSCAA